MIQRNALKSWTLLHPEAEIILFGDEEGYAEAATEFGLRHEPKVGRNEFGTILISSMFEKAQALSKHNLLCYVNCDIVLLPDFFAALQIVKDRQQPFLMIGRRWDMDITQPLAFDCPDWHQGLRRLALREGKRRGADWIDYFAFSHGVYQDRLLDFAVGRTCWDNWLVWKAMTLGHAVVDASPLVVAVHQNHDYSHHPEGAAGVWFGEEMARNVALAGRVRHLCTISHAAFSLTKKGLVRNRFHKLGNAWWKTRRAGALVAEQALIAWQNAFWHPALNLTRPVRSILGLRKAGARRKP